MSRIHRIDVARKALSNERLEKDMAELPRVFRRTDNRD
jgi:hypothetical protein